MRLPASHELPANHPCFGCQVRDLAVCHVLDPAALAAYKQQGWTMRVKAGQAIFHEGDPATRVFTLTSGALKLYRLLLDGRRQIVGFMFPGDFLGITLDDEHAFTVEAIEDSQLCWFARSRFDEFVAAHAQLEHSLYRLAANELAAAQHQMVLLGRKSAEERVASFFLDLLLRAERASRRVECMIDLPMTRADIADFLGLTKETVSRVLSSLKGKRVIRLQALDRIEILDRPWLVSIAEGMAKAA